MKQVTLTALLLVSSLSVAASLKSVTDELTQISIAESQCMHADGGDSTMGMKMCMAETDAAFDVVLNREYTALLGAVDGETKSRLEQSQKDWIAFRISNCAWQASSMLGGTGESVVEMACYNASTKSRIQEIAEFSEQAQ